MLFRIEGEGQIEFHGGVSGRRAGGGLQAATIEKNYYFE
jgi:hypothetical protein